MSIEQEVKEELKDAMRSKDQNRLDVLRQIQTDISKAKTEPGFKGDVDDALYKQVIAAYAKKMTKAMGEYEKAGERGKEMVEKLGFEVDYLGRWLPKKLDEAATRELVKKIVADLGVSDPKQTGRVMGAVMKQHKDEVDAGVVKKILAEVLAG